MEALLCKKVGDPTLLPPNSSESSPLVLSTSHPIPELNSPTAVRVRVRATSLNYANYLQILGKYQEKPPLPFIPGSDYSGIVESIGPNVSKFKIGDPVCSFAALGTFAQFIVADETELFRVPDGCDLVAAGALPVAYGTSHVALVHRARLSSGQVLLVLGAAGGVGLSAVQIGKVCGATVIAVARGAEKAQFLKSLGVDHVIDLSRTNVTESVKGFLKTRKLKGVDVLYDPVGGKLTKETMKLLNWGAQILVIGFASGEVPVIPANIALVKNETVVKTLAAELDKAGLSVRIVTMQVLPIVRPVSNLSFPTQCVGGTNIGTGQFMDSTGEATRYIDQANLAFSVMKDRKVVGKVMITLDDHKNVRSKL